MIVLICISLTMFVICSIRESIPVTPRSVEYHNRLLIPVPRMDKGIPYDWNQRHEDKVTEAKRSNHDIVFIGDSITHFWETVGEKTWGQYPKAMNLGFGGDNVSQVLWRLDNGEMTSQTPKVVVIMIGTNNLGSPPEEVADAIKLICERIKKISPQSRILLMGILPRSSANGTQPVEKIPKINDQLKAYASGRVTFLNIGDKFLSADGSISDNLMADGLHPTAAGYKIWADAIQEFTQ